MFQVTVTVLSVDEPPLVIVPPAETVQTYEEYPEVVV
jgi:hypothetical protein